MRLWLEGRGLVCSTASFSMAAAAAPAKTLGAKSNLMDRPIAGNAFFG
jgi:hypothetical protein